MISDCRTFSIIRHLFMVLGILFSLCLAAHAQQYFKKWTTEDGLPQINVINIAQTPDGYLWVATVDGLARFDGVRFKVFNKSNTPEMPNNRIFSMFTDTAGRLWFTYPDDQTVVVYENGKFKAFEKGRDFEKDDNINSFPDYYIRRFRDWSRNSEMRLLAGDIDYVYENERFVPRPALENGFPSRVFSTENDRNSVWIDEADALYHVVNEKVKRYGKDAPLPVDPKQVFPIDSAEKDGTLWFPSKSDGDLPLSGLLSFKDGKIKTFPTIRGVIELELDGKGNLWVADWQKGIIKVDAEAIARNDTTGFVVAVPSPEVQWKIFRDRDDNIWVGGQRGLYLINSDPAVTFFSKESQPPIDNVYPIVQDAEGTIWFVTWTNHRLFSYRDGKFSSEYAPFFLSSLFIDSRSRLWKGSGSVLSYRENDKWVPVNFRKSLISSWNGKEWRMGELSFIAEDREGNMWLGTEAGLIRYANGVSRIFMINDGLPSNVITSYLLTRTGEMWVGTNNGVARMENGRFQGFTEKDGLAGNYTRSFYQDGEGTIWIGGYDGGLTRYKNGSFAKITKRDGLFSDGVFVILEDDQGWFWMNSNQGIYRVRKQELNDFADGKVGSVTSVSYGPEDGLVDVEGNGGKQPAGLKAKDGKLWFPMAKGVAVIDPRTVRRASVPPRVLIEETRIDQKPLELSANGIRLEPNQVSLEIDYTAVGFVGGERMRFRHRLEELDEGWTEAGTRRTAYFSHLPYGTYTFRVIAANYDGVWNTEGAIVRITVVPPFYREWWFYALVVLGVFGIITSIYLLRLRQLRMLNEARAGFTRRLIESQEGERRRIALELHDSLGQILAVIRNRTIMGLEAKDTTQVIEQLREISEASSLALRETREIAHNLHPAQIENLGLTTALRSLVKSVESSTGMRCEANIGEVPGNLSYDAAISIYRITQECIGNIIKHSGASFAAVSLRLIEGKLALSIKDDGRGFIESQTPKGLGLTGIRERAKMVGAELTIDSQPGEGTTVTLVLPII